MGNMFIQRFAFIFVALLILQECHSFILHGKSGTLYDDELQSPVNLEHINVVSLREKDFDDFNVDTKSSSDVATYSKNRNEKRWVNEALLILGLISAAADIYWFARQCKDVEPRLEGNVNEIVRLQTQAVAQRDRINLDWNPIVTTDLYFTRLGTSFTDMYAAVSLLDTLKTDIITLLDSSIFTKLDLKKREIENQLDLGKTGTFGGSAAALTASFYTTTSFAFQLSIKLGPAALWLGGKTIFPKIGQAISDHFARKWAAANPGRVTQLVKSAHTNIGGVTTNIRTGWADFVNMLPSRPKLGDFVTLSKGEVRFINNAKAACKFAAKGAVVGLFVAMDAYQQWKKVMDCKKRYSDSITMIGNVTRSIAQMNGLEIQMTNLHNDLKSNYTKMHNVLTSQNVLNFVNETLQLGKNAENQTDALAKAATKLQQFLAGIQHTVKANGDFKYQDIENLVKAMLDGFRLTNYKLSCYRKKLSLITSITDSCAAGIGTYQSLWELAKKNEGKASIQECIVNQKYLSRNEVDSIISGFMDVMGKQRICVRNNADKKHKACGFWYKDWSNANNTMKTGGVQLADIEYFVSSCPPGNVAADMHDGICKKKSDRKTLAEVLQIYTKYNQGQITSVYNGCKLSPNQKENICTMKQQGHKLDVVKAKYVNYLAASVTDHYNNCKPKMTPSDVEEICMFKRLGYCKNEFCPFYATKEAKYGQPAITAAFKGCAKKDSSSYMNIMKKANEKDIKQQTHDEVLKELEDYFGLRK